MRRLGLIKTAGLVTKTTKYGETSLIVTIITKDLGKISVIANNARSNRSRMFAGLQLFAYSEFVLYKGKGKKGLYSLNEVTVAESFSGISASLEKLAYASYFAEIVNCVATEDSPEEEILRLLLNVLYVLNGELQPNEKIKTVFEWRIAHICGYSPLVENCGNCGANEKLTVLSLTEGMVLCENCAENRENTVNISPTMIKIIDYICASDSKQIFSFDAGKDTISYLSRVSEAFIQTQLEQNFPTLDYLHKVTALEETK